MTTLELLAPLVMNVLPPAIDYFLCGSLKDDDEIANMLCLGTAAGNGEGVNDDFSVEDDAHKKGRYAPKKGTKGIPRRWGHSGKRRPIEVSCLSLEDMSYACTREMNDEDDDGVADLSIPAIQELSSMVEDVLPSPGLSNSSREVARDLSLDDDNGGGYSSPWDCFLISHSTR